MRKKRFTEYCILSLFCLTILACCVSCARKPEGYPSVFPCSITVEKDGSPINGAELMLIPAEGTSSLSIGATTDVQGVAAFHTAMGSFVQDGVPDGSWKVLVSKGPVVEGTKTKEEQAAMPEEEWKKYQREIEAKAKKLPPIVPYILGSPSTTPIVLTVAGQKTGLTIDIAKYKDMPEIIRNATKSSPVE